MTPTILKIHRSCDGRLTITAPLELWTRAGIEPTGNPILKVSTEKIAVKTSKALVDALVKEPAS